ncbi:MAG: MATE family efflux transporter [Lachnospiraceae bacterium]|nr:MATE family efflux transporter [Lachnospiraceae bacterium]
MLVQALYNVVDSIFVAKIGENALTAVTLAFPMQNMMIALAAGTGVGINALLSRSLGERRFDRSDEAANVGIFLTFMNFLLFLLMGIFLSRGFIASQTANEEIINDGTAYLGIVCTLSLGLFCQVTFERLLQSTGRTFFSMISQLTGAIINIIFDPILIFGLLGFPALGVAGAAYATVFGQTVAAFLGLFLNIKYNPDIKIRISQIIKPKGDAIKEIYFVGIPSILMMSIGSLMTYLMNNILIAFSTTATAVFGVYFKLQSFFFMPVFGMNNGLIPVLAYNYGAKKKDRIDEALRFSLVLAVIIMSIGTIVFEAVPGLLLSMFSASEDMLSIGIPAMRIIAIHFPMAACSIVMGSIFQAFSKSIYSLIVSVGRQLIVLIPVAYLLALTGNLNAVWFAFPIAEVISLLLSLIFFKKVYGVTAGLLKGEEAE